MNFAELGNKELARQALAVKEVIDYRVKEHYSAITFKEERIEKLEAEGTSGPMGQMSYVETEIEKLEAEVEEHYLQISILKGEE